MGSWNWWASNFSEEVRNYKDENPRFSPFFIPKMIANIAGGLISIKYGFRGPNFTTVSACASASHAMIEAFNYDSSWESRYYDHRWF